MQIEAGEIIFGKRWDEWTEEEKQEFVSVMEPEDMGYPIYLNLALKYQGQLPVAGRRHLESLLLDAKLKKQQQA
jgi:hypothetical protein